MNVVNVLANECGCVPAKIYQIGLGQTYAKHALAKVYKNVLANVTI
jgi:hypothetical protein